MHSRKLSYYRQRRSKRKYLYPADYCRSLSVLSYIFIFPPPVDFHKLCDIDETITLYNISFDHYFSSSAILQKLISQNNVIINLDSEKYRKCEKIIELLAESTAVSDEYTEKT